MGLLSIGLGFLCAWACFVQSNKHGLLSRLSFYVVSYCLPHLLTPKITRLFLETFVHHLWKIMDPLSLLGGVSAVGAIAAAITKTIKNLSDARGRYEGADLTIQSLIYELTTVKFALNQIHQWAHNHLPSSPTRGELVQALNVSLEGCRLAVDIMAEDVALLVTNNPFLRSVKVVWNEASMRDHQNRLQSQVAALQLLLQAAHW